MSLTPIGGSLLDGTRHKITTASLREQKLHHAPITCLTAYDYAAARLVEDGIGIPILLGRGVRLWDGLEALEQHYDVEAVSTPRGVTHLTFTR